MARNMYGATPDAFTITSGGRVIPGAELDVWTPAPAAPRSPT